MKICKLFYLKIILMMVFFGLNTSFINAQNLVNNWSFEDTLACPFGPGQIDFAQNYYAFRGTPDLFNNCNSSQVSTPNNFVDFQIPRTGNSYGGLLVYNHISTNIREVLGMSLNSQLQLNTKYYCSFFVSRTVNSGSNNVNVAINKIGMQFSTVQYSPSSPSPINNISQIYTDSLLTDTIGWTRISGSFLADSNYSFVGISAFFPDSALSVLLYLPNSVNAYYFIEDICISSDSLYCDQLSFVEQIDNNSQIKIFPNPARDWIVVRGESIQSLRFYDVSGKLTLTISSPIPTTINISSLSAGFYYVILETKNCTSFQKLIVNY